MKEFGADRTRRLADVLALIKAQSMRYFAFSLLAILVSFSGIYTRLLIGAFSPEYLIAYLQACERRIDVPRSTRSR